MAISKLCLAWTMLFASHCSKTWISGISHAILKYLLPTQKTYSKVFPLAPKMCGSEANVFSSMATFIGSKCHNQIHRFINIILTLSILIGIIVIFNYYENKFDLRQILFASRNVSAEYQIWYFNRIKQQQTTNKEQQQPTLYRKFLIIRR